LIFLLLVLGCDGTSHISGDVYDSENRPIKEALVKFSERLDERHLCEVKTSSDGSFGCGLMHAPFSGIRLRITVVKTGYKTSQIEFTSDEAKRKLESKEKFRIVLERE
jgi:hypothetical protein